MRFPWFAIRVRTRGEFLVETALRGKSYETFLPTYMESRQYSDRVKKTQAALFPGYLFCRFDPEQRLPILTTPGVHHIISNQEGPTPVDENEMAAVQRLVAEPNHLARPWPFLKVGSRVRIEIGSLEGVEGILVTQKGVDRIVVSVTILGRAVAAQVDRAWVRPIDSGSTAGSR